MKRAHTQTVLIVEDDKALNDAYQQLLQHAGYTVHTCFNGEEALLLATHLKPDLIILDLRMPRMNGLEFLRHYGPPHTHRKTKVIVMSNYDDESEITQAYALGAERYMAKKWASPDSLLHLIHHTLNDK